QAIFDWMDPDDKPIGGVGDSEVAFYSEWIAKERKIDWDRQTALIRPKNDLFTTLDELLLVPGVTPQLFYGYDPTDEKEVKKREKDLAEGKEVARGLRDCLTIYSSGKLNMNTATYESLAALFGTGANNLEEGEKRAEEVLRYLGRTSKSEPDNDKAFRSPQEVMTSQSAVFATIFGPARNAHDFNVMSSNFVIEGTGTALDAQGDPTVTRRLTVLVRRAYQQYPIEKDFDQRRRRSADHDELLKKLNRSQLREMEKIGAATAPNVRALWWREN
ncbi:MAG: hypothetical protein NTW86_19040, partial [Candidatus Sumerlaeota bacterium]|nr:hypothetical protein [Candidatus Sumerlaeota bacterium]